MWSAKNRIALHRLVPSFVLMGIILLLTACSHPRLIGLVYTNIRLPLTRNLDHTPVPVIEPPSDKVLEIREPITGAGIYAQVDTNAIGAIAKQNGMKTLYFADQQIFSILGIWSTSKTILYGE